MREGQDNEGRIACRSFLDVIRRDNAWLGQRPRCLLVDTIPKDARNQGSVNLGFEYVADLLGADRCFWWDEVEGEYDIIAFNVFYPTHLLNIYPFLKRNGIEAYRDKREKPILVAGSQGVGQNGILDRMCDYTFYGEFDGDCRDKKRMWRRVVLDTPVIVKGNKAAIELTRGCKYRCTFCEYSWVHGGKYREKPFELVKAQIDECLAQDIKSINFISANFGGYSKVTELYAYAESKGIRILNADACLKDIEKVLPFAEKRYVKLGLESFDEKARAAVGKRISDEELDALIDKLIEVCSGIHFYLIYGLSDDDHDRWFYWLERLAEKRAKYTDRGIRFEFSITNFEPCAGTPMEDFPQVDFRAKHKFLKRWGDALIQLGFHKGEYVWYPNCGGRFGRKPLSYALLMALKTSGPEVLETMIKRYPRGIRRSIKDNVAERWFK